MLSSVSRKNPSAGNLLKMGVSTCQSVIYMLMLVASVQTTTERNPNWAQKLLDSVSARDSFIPYIDAFIQRIDTQSIKNLIDGLETFPSQLKGLDNLTFTSEEQSGELATAITDLPDNPPVSIRNQFHSGNLESHYTTRGFGFILSTLKNALSPSQPFTGSAMPLAQMCAKAQEDIGNQEKYTFSADKICRNVKQCSGTETPHPYNDEYGTNVQEACTEESNACNIEKAIPMMGALLWYKVSDYIAQSFCHNHLEEPEKSVIQTEYGDVEKMASSISAYTSTLNFWPDFFDQVKNSRVYSNLPNAMNLVEEREKSFKFASLACLELDASDMCTIGDIFKYYESLKKLKKDRENPSNTTNLRLHSRVDHGKMIELKKETLQHITLLGNIESLDENVDSLVTGMKGYFLGLAKYDQGIADQDVIFLQGKLDDFETRAVTLSEKVQKDTEAVMIAANVALLAQLAQEIAILAAKIANHFNPVKVIFTGVEVADIHEQAAEVARASQESVHGAALFATFSEVYSDMAKLAEGLKENADQITALQTMIKAIKENGVEDIGFDSQRFIEAYGGYTPKVDRSALAKNDALWGAYKDSTCDLLFGAEGVGAGITQGVVGGMLLCEKLEGTLAEFFALRENIFDFQFELVDALASVVRGNIAKKLSESIAVKNDPLKLSTLLLGFFMTQYRLQFEAALYCDKWQYLNQGQIIKPCMSKEFFDEHRLDDLLSYDFGTHYHEDERFVFIPTKAQFQGDTGFINLPSLTAGNPVTFRLPANHTWLQQFNWLSRGETRAPFVASFKLYLPLRNYNTEGSKQHSKTRIKLASIAGSRVNTSSAVVYNVPLEHSSYMTLYEEGYDPAKCPRGKEIMNPYSLCDNLPLICDTMTRVPGSVIMPTILSTWKLSLSVETGHVNLHWDAPRPATNLLIIAKVKLRYLPSSGRKRRTIQFNAEPAFGCCSEANTFRPKWSDRTCIPCPTSVTNSVSKLRGYYCAKGNEPVAREPPEDLYTTPSTTAAPTPAGR